MSIKARIIRYKDLIGGRWDYKTNDISIIKSAYKRVKLSTLIKKVNNKVDIDVDKSYELVKVRLWNKGIISRELINGSEIGSSILNEVAGRLFIVSKIGAKKGAYGIIPNSLTGAVVTNEFVTYENIDELVLSMDYLNIILSYPHFTQIFSNLSYGLQGRERLDMSLFLSIEVPLPTLEEQIEIIRPILTLNLAKLKLESAEILLKSALKNIINL